MGLERIDTQLDDMSIGDRYIVRTTDEHTLTLEIRRNGPYTKGSFIAFVSAEPLITETLFFPGEIHVVDDTVIEGKEFVLTSLLPLLSQRAFCAMEINYLVESSASDVATSE